MYRAVNFQTVNGRTNWIKSLGIGTRSKRRYRNRLTNLTMTIQIQNTMGKLRNYLFNPRYTPLIQLLANYLQVVYMTAKYNNKYQNKIMNYRVCEGNYCFIYWTTFMTRVTISVMRFEAIEASSNEEQKGIYVSCLRSFVSKFFLNISNRFT